MALTDSTRIPAAPDRMARDTRSVIAGAQQRETPVLPPAPPPGAAEIDRVRAAVWDALSDFLEVQRETLAAMDPSLVPVIDEVCALADGGKRLRPLFAYWGWRGVRGEGPAESDEAVLRAVAALEFVHASALVHDDVMDGAHTRRGRPATHIGFATRHAVDDLDGDEDLFGTGAALRMPNPITGSEDFSRIIAEVPGAMLFLGALVDGRDPLTAPSNHAPQAAFDDSVLAQGTALYATLAARRLAQVQPQVTAG